MGILEDLEALRRPAIEEEEKRRKEEEEAERRARTEEEEERRRAEGQRKKELSKILDLSNEELDSLYKYEFEFDMEEANVLQGGALRSKLDPRREVLEMTERQFLLSKYLEYTNVLDKGPSGPVGHVIRRTGVRNVSQGPCIRTGRSDEQKLIVESDDPVLDEKANCSESADCYVKTGLELSCRQAAIAVRGYDLYKELKSRQEAKEREEMKSKQQQKGKFSLSGIAQTLRGRNNREK